MYFFLNPASNAEAVAVISNGAKIVFAKGTATLINRPANLLIKILRIHQIELF